MKSARIAKQSCGPARAIALIVALGTIAVPVRPAQKDASPGWETKIQPIFAQHCVGCHGPETQMAGLRLDRGEAALKGGLNGPVIVANRSSESRIIERVSLPRTDSRAMPPQGNPGPSEEQVRALIDWIDGGAVVPASHAESNPEAEEAPPVPYTVLTGSVDTLRFEEKIEPFLRHYCYDCHSKTTREGGLAIEDYAAQWPGEDLRSWDTQWGKVARAITTGAMPHPRQQRKPSEEERELFGLWFDEELESRATPGSSRPSNPRLRQMTGFEYDNTIRALTGLDLGLSHLTQPGGVASDGGFLNQGREMQLSPSKLSRYLQAADQIVAHASIDPQQGIRFHAETGSARSDSSYAKSPQDLRTAAQRHLPSFAERAYRRPLHEEEMAGLMGLYDRQIESGKGFEAACRQVMQGILASPQFVYLSEEHRWERKLIHWSDKKREKSEATALMADHEVASRLSYFLWSAPPDEKLITLAIEQRLHDPEVLKAQVKRMLADPKAASLATQFAGYWLKFNCRCQVIMS